MAEAVQITIENRDRVIATLNGKSKNPSGSVSFGGVSYAGAAGTAGAGGAGGVIVNLDALLSPQQLTKRHLDMATDHSGAEEEMKEFFNGEPVGGSDGADNSTWPAIMAPENTDDARRHMARERTTSPPPNYPDAVTSIASTATVADDKNCEDEKLQMAQHKAEDALAIPDDGMYTFPAVQMNEVEQAVYTTPMWQQVLPCGPNGALSICIRAATQLAQVDHFHMDENCSRFLHGGLSGSVEKLFDTESLKDGDFAVQQHINEIGYCCSTSASR